MFRVRWFIRPSMYIVGHKKATEFRCGGRFYFTLFRSLSTNPKVKELLKWPTFAKVIVKIKVAPFLWPTVRVSIQQCIHVKNVL